MGLYLADADGNEVLLPNKYVPPDFRIGDPMEVFVYRDSEDRQVATTQRPALLPGQLALLPITAVNRTGAFARVGLEKDLLVPFAEQQERMQAGRSYVVYMALDRKTDRLYGSSRIDRFLDNSELQVAEGDEVQVIPYHRSELGWSVAVNGKHRGLLHHSDVHRDIRAGDRFNAYIKHIRPDHKLDISVQPLGYQHYNDANVQLLAEKLQASGGRLPYTDKSSPQEIRSAFGLSKKAFKQAVGALYKARRIKLLPDAIEWTGGPGANS